MGQKRKSRVAVYAALGVCTREGGVHAVRAFPVWTALCIYLKRTSFTNAGISFLPVATPTLLISLSNFFLPPSAELLLTSVRHALHDAIWLQLFPHLRVSLAFCSVACSERLSRRLAGLMNGVVFAVAAVGDRVFGAKLILGVSVSSHLNQPVCFPSLLK